MDALGQPELVTSVVPLAPGRAQHPSAPARRPAAVLLIITSLLWLHEWTPVIFVLGFVAWVLAHRRLEGEAGRRLASLCRRGWPPPAAVLVPLLLVGTAAYWAVDLPLTNTVLPIAMNLLALSLVAFGRWWPRRRPRALAAARPGTALASPGHGGDVTPRAR